MAISKKRLILVFALIVGAAVFTFSAFADTGILRLDWTTKLKVSGTASKKTLNFATPTVVGEKVYVGSVGGMFYVVDLGSGKKIWETKLEGPVMSKPLVESDTIFVGDGKGVVYSINAETGEINWHAYIGEEVMTMPASDDNTIYVMTQDNSMVALDKSAGAIRWTGRRQAPFSSLSIKGHSSPVVVGERVYAGNSDGVLVGYNRKDGNKVSVIPLAAGRAQFTDIDTQPLIIGDRMFVSSLEGAIYSLDYRNGKEYWSAPVGSPNNIAYYGGQLFVTAEGRVYCLDEKDGKEVWVKDLDVTGLSSAAVTDKYLFVSSTSDKLYLLDRSTGDVLMERHLGGGTFGSPTVSGNRLLILTNKGNLYAFRIEE